MVLGAPSPVCQFGRWWSTLHPRPGNTHPSNEPRNRSWRHECLGPLNWPTIGQYSLGSDNLDFVAKLRAVQKMFTIWTSWERLWSSLTRLKQRKRKPLTHELTEPKSLDARILGSTLKQNFPKGTEPKIIVTRLRFVYEKILSKEWFPIVNSYYKSSTLNKKINPSTHLRVDTTVIKNLLTIKP